MKITLNTVFFAMLLSLATPKVAMSRPEEPSQFSCTIQQVNSGISSAFFAVGDTMKLDLRNPDDIFPEFTKPSGAVSKWMTISHPLFRILEVTPAEFQIALRSENISGGFQEINSIAIEQHETLGTVKAWITLSIEYSTGHWTLIHMTADCLRG